MKYISYNVYISGSTSLISELNMILVADGYMFWFGMNLEQKISTTNPTKATNGKKKEVQYNIILSNREGEVIKL